MNEFKRFDKYQLLIGIVTASLFLIATILFIVMLLTSQMIIENDIVQEVIYNPVLLNIFLFFTFGHLLGSIWFVARLLTYKLRKKEQDLL